MRIGLQFPALLLQHLIIPEEAHTPELEVSEVIEMLHHVGEVLHLQMILLKLMQFLLPILLQGQVLSPSLFEQHLIIPGEAQTPVLKLSKVVEIFHHVSQVLHLQMIGLQFSKVVEIFHPVGQVLHLQMIGLQLLQILLPILLQTDHRNTASNIPGGGTNSQGPR